MNSDTATREALARTLRQIENDAAGIVAPGPFEALSDTARGMWLDQAGRLLASPALDAVLAKRVTALAEYGTFVHDVAQRTSLEPFEHMFAIRAQARSVLRALAAALTERSQS